MREDKRSEEEEGVRRDEMAWYDRVWHGMGWY